MKGVGLGRKISGEIACCTSLRISNSTLRSNRKTRCSDQRWVCKHKPMILAMDPIGYLTSQLRQMVDSKFNGRSALRNLNGQLQKKQLDINLWPMYVQKKKMYMSQMHIWCTHTHTHMQNREKSVKLPFVHLVSISNCPFLQGPVKITDKVPFQD